MVFPKISTWVFFWPNTYLIIIEKWKKTTAVRSRISSKLIRSTCKLRGILRSRVLRALRWTKSDKIWQHPTKSDSCRPRGGYEYTYTVYFLKVLQEVGRDPAQAWCLGSCGSLDAHAVGAARTCTMMRTCALLNIRSYIPPKGVHTCVTLYSINLRPSFA